jgi:hypothetical protein
MTELGVIATQMATVDLHLLQQPTLISTLLFRLLTPMLDPMDMLSIFVIGSHPKSQQLGLQFAVTKALTSIEILRNPMSIRQSVERILEPRSADASSRLRSN